MISTTTVGQEWADPQDFSWLEMSNLENTTGLFVNKARDTLDTSSAGQSPDGWLSDTLNVITKNLPVTLCTSLAKTFAALASARHDCKTNEHLKRLWKW